MVACVRRPDHVRCTSSKLPAGERHFGWPDFLGPDGTPRAESAYGVRLLFTGREYLAPVGLYDYRHRAYSPTLARFLQVDPMRFTAGTWSLYIYSRNGCTLVRDPMGLFFEIGEPIWDQLPRGHESAAREMTAMLRAEWEAIRGGRYSKDLQHLANLFETSADVSVVMRVGRTGGLGCVRQPGKEGEPYLVVMAPFPELWPLRTLVHELLHVMIFVAKRQPCSEFARDPVVQTVMAAIRALPGGPEIDIESSGNKGRRFSDAIVDWLIRPR